MSDKSIVNKRGRDFLGDLKVDSYVAWNVDLDDTYVYGTVKIADCNRSIELGFSDLKDLAKLDVLRDHIDRFEREFRKLSKLRRQQSA